jgi:hypothetical protein
MVPKTDMKLALEWRERCRVWWYVALSDERDLVSSSAGRVLLLSVPFTGLTDAIGAASNIGPTRQQSSGLACSEPKNL